MIARPGERFPLVPVAAAILLFTVLAVAVSLHLTMGFDRAVILSLRDSANIARLPGPQWLADATRDVTSLGSIVVVMIFSVIVSGYWLFNGAPRSAALLLGPAIGALLVNDVLKLVFDRPRPDAVLQAAHVFSAGFPSGHAALSSTVYFLAALLSARTARERTRGWLVTTATVVVGLIGFSRIYLGVHYPTDVIAGWCVGAVWVCCCNPAIARLPRH
jgi:undecaprenyl-diphosphatase